MSSEQVRNTEDGQTWMIGIKEKYGAIAADEFGAMYVNRIKQVNEAIERMELSIREGNTVKFESAARYHITDSARMNSFRGNFEDVHVLATIAHSISNRWAGEQGKNPRCSLHSLYARAWRQAAAENGHHGMAEPPTDCYCEEVSA